VTAVKALADPQLPPDAPLILLVVPRVVVIVRLPLLGIVDTWRMLHDGIEQREDSRE